MRGHDQQTGHCSVICRRSNESRRTIRCGPFARCGPALTTLSPQFTALYLKRAAVDCPGEAAARPVAAGVLHSAQRAAVDGAIGVQPAVPLVCRPDLDEPVWDATVFTKNRDRLLAGDVATAFFEQVLAQAKAQRCCPTSISRSMGR